MENLDKLTKKDLIKYIRELEEENKLLKETIEQRNEVETSNFGNPNRKIISR